MRVRVALLLLIPLMMYQALVVYGGTAVTSELFHRVVYSSDKTYDVKLPSTTLSRCAGHCLGSTACRSLCYNVTTAVCYMYEGFPSTAQPLGGDIIDMRCYTSSACPSTRGYWMHGGLCLKLYTDAMSYLDATLRCGADGAHLVHCKSEEDRTALQSLFRSEGISGRFWVGADDQATEGSFVWRSDGSPLLTTDVLWSTGEPDNSGSGQDCITLQTDFFTFDDVTCERQCKFVCQVDMW